MKEEKNKVFKEAEGKVTSQIAAEEALSIAIYNEESALDFYTRLSEVITNQSGKEKFRLLASDERRHRELLENYDKKLTDGEDFPFDPTKVRRIKVGVRDNTTAFEALDLGIKAEKEAYQFYIKSSEEAKDPEAKRMFLMLAEQEDRHYNILTAEKQALTGQFYWFSLDTPGIMEH